MCFGVIKHFAIFGNTIVAFCYHLVITVSDVTFEKLKAVFDTQLGCNSSELLLLTLLIVCVVSKHLTVNEGGGVVGMHWASLDYLVIIGQLAALRQSAVPLSQLAQEQATQFLCYRCCQRF